ncbi:MAG: DNA translocase FtsK 4TM domain-containing protein [Acetatifactor sp.]
MAGSTGKRTSTSKNKKKTANTGRKSVQSRQVTEQEAALFHEIGLIVLFVCMVLLFCCNFGIIGPVGDKISLFLFGVFGLMAYIVPILLFLGVAFRYANEGNPSAVRKLIAGVVLFLMIGVVCDLLAGDAAVLESYSLKEIYKKCSNAKNGGGIFAGSFCYLLQHYLGTIGTVLVVLLCSAISIILLTERSLLDGVKNSGNRVIELSREDARRRKEYNDLRRQELEEQRARREEERRLRAEEKENQKILRMEKKVSGVMTDTALVRPEEANRRDDIHEIMYNEEIPEESVAEEMSAEIPGFDFEKVRIRSAHQISMPDDFSGGEEYPEPAETAETAVNKNGRSSLKEMPAPGTDDLLGQSIRIHKEGVSSRPQEESPLTAKLSSENVASSGSAGEIQKDIAHTEKKIPKKYMFPPLSRLQKGVAAAGDSTRELKETAMRLQQTLNTFGVKVTITDISQGPSVTRYELQPEQGVKVSKIVGLADDIKLNLAATDIRIEAPIPGKAAIGIEVPNKENMPVALRDLLESKEFREFPSNLAFAVGKDIAGKVVVADIAKMPHMLIAGATGSGKSVCINTMIMSTLYKAHPDDVKLIMIDPKVVELSVYNGIPHLLIPVVTDPKKASAALHWGVTEMEDRYRKFADFNVRDLKGYNKKLETMQESGEENVPAKLPQIIIIVDELADLMMVSPGEVEESICRLAQLARAAGIHLIIATQRPSVDVITGLIKANMPSRVAFSVSSGVDSRTILDMNGAEKLLGKGDMLFYPQGYSKPARIQGAFVSDKEVSDVVDFLKNQSLGNTYAEDVEEKIQSIGSGTGGGSTEEGSELDEFFEKAGRFIIEQDKASIGALQRLLKIGFNRAARIMDQLCEYGVVDKGEGTKPRKILMSPEQFEQLVEEIV